MDGAQGEEISVHTLTRMMLGINIGALHSMSMVCIFRWSAQLFGHITGLRRRFPMHYITWPNIPSIPNAFVRRSRKSFIEKDGRIWP